MNAIRLAALILTVAALLDSRPQQPPAQQKVPRHDAAAVVKLVPVRVFDAAGNPILDLKKADFVLFDNKERKTITEFEVHALRGVPAEFDLSGTELGTTPVPELGRKYFIYLDFQANDIAGNANAKKAAIEFVETRLLPGDEVALLYYAGMTGLNMVEYLTADKAKLKKLIERTREIGAGGGGGQLAGGYGMATEYPRVMVSTTVSSQGQARGEMRGDAAQIIPQEGAMMRVSQNVEAGRIELGMVGSATPPLGLFGRNTKDFIDNMGELAEALHYIPGAKSIIFFSARTAIPPGLARAFAATNTPVFTVNTQNWIMRGGVRQKYIWTDHPLKEFAEASGGRYFSDIMAVETIAAGIQAFSANYYVLGYYVNLAWDGKSHRIEVQVNRPGARVFVQEGYDNPKPFAQWSDIEKKLQIYDLAFADRPASRDALDLPLRPFLADDGKGRSGIVLAGLEVNEKTGIPAGKAELFVFVFEKGGQTVRSLRTEMDFSALEGRTVCPYVSIPLPAGEYEVRFVARDMATGQSAAGKSEFAVPPAPDAAAPKLRFSAPLLLVAGREPHYLKLNWPGKGAETSTLADYYPLLPKKAGPLIGPLRSDEKSLLAVLTAEFPAGTAPSKVNLNFRLTNAGGDEFPVATRIVETKKIATTRSALALEINLPDLSPGEYVLDITCEAAEAGSGRVLRSAFTIK